MSIVDPGNNHQRMLKILRQKLMRKFTIDGSGWQHPNPGIDLNILKKGTDSVCHMTGRNRNYTTPPMEISEKYHIRKIKSALHPISVSNYQFIGTKEQKNVK